MDRIVIAISKLDRNNWEIIYKFIKNIVLGADTNSKIESYKDLEKIANGVRLKTNLSPDTTTDVYSLYGEANFDVAILSKDTCFSILYKKNNNGEDLTELVPFTLIQHEFGPSITLGIDICSLSESKSYTFKCGDFFYLHDNIKPKLGDKSIYLIEEKVDEKTGNIKLVTRHLPGKGDGEKSEYQRNASRRFLPLIHVEESNYASLFSEKGNDDSRESSFVKNGIRKIRQEFEEIKDTKTKNELKKIFDYGNLFGQWIEAAYFHSYEKEELVDMNNNNDSDKREPKDKINGIESFRRTLQIYKDSIQELVQNILVHGEKNGIIYCVFDKKANISESVRKLIPNSDYYNESDRFMRVGIFDFGEQGIVDTFLQSEQIDKDNAIKKEERSAKLTDFFDINSIVTTGLTRSDMRYAAHLGIKTFVKTIGDHKGYFSVESCEHIQGKQIKKMLYSKAGSNNTSLSEEMITSFVNGTHYEIILPVIKSNIQESSSVLVQTTSISEKFSELLREPYPLLAVRIMQDAIEEIGLSKNKQGQKASIENICNEIIDKCNIHKKDEKSRGVALDLCNRFVSPSSIFKIAAYLQLHLKNPLQKIVLVNVTSEFTKMFCSLIDKYLVRKSNNEIPIWSRDCALIILCGDLHARIIWGRNKDELYYINREYKRLYYNHFLDVAKNDNPFEIGNGGIEENSKTDAERFVLPYDVLIRTDVQEPDKNYTSPFERFLDQLLRRKIISSPPGLSVNHENTYIGRKIIVKNYYEADSLFQNNFFVERIAYLIARNIKQEFFSDKNKYEKKTIVLIGYKYYSEFLLKTIKEQMKPSYSIRLGICNEGKDFGDNNVTFNFGINDDGKETEMEIIANPDKYVFATIVPIGATLSTNDKIISFFKQWLESKTSNRESQKELLKEISSCQKLQFFYNHCAIVVRDKVRETVTTLEYEQKWEKVNSVEHFVITRYKNAKKVHYSVQIDDGHGKGNWIKRLNNEISFPKDWKNEKYVNLTENSSINSQNLMDYPKIDADNEKEEEELEHIYQLKDFIYKGHLQKTNCHHKFYIDTESFVRQKKTIMVSWLNDLLNKKQKFFHINQNTLNVLVTPDVESESDFVSAVNEVVFDGSALIIYMDVNNWRNNIVNKLSFLKSIPNVRYHYVDQAFLTGETYRKTKSYLFSIIEKEDIKFCSAFTIVNRLPYAKNKEIREDLNHNLFAYVNLHYPMGNDWEQECELCRLEKYYENLSGKTVLQSCSEVICRNKDKINLKNIVEIKKSGDMQEKEHLKWHNRVFLRLVITHWLYYRISKIAILDIDFETKKEYVKKELDNNYSSLCGNSEYDNCLLNQKIEQWFNTILFSKNEKLILDKKISFLKVISSPPLSQYITIREYAHERLLEELHKTINKKEQFVVDDLKVVKSILKSLSFLKSNALVRKEVIIGVWKMLEIVIKGMDEENKRITIQDFSKDVQFFVKNTIIEDEAKATFLGELLRRGEEITTFDKIQISNTKLMLVKDASKVKNSSQNELFSAFNNCEYDFLRQEYSRFLVWLFYDNTTIIRNTLTNFSKELDKDEQIRMNFYDKDILRGITDFNKDIEEIKKLFNAKVKEEYYYSSFMPYLENADGIDFIEKLIYIAYAKLKLEDLITNKNKTLIETDTQDLMEIFAAIMGADAAFWTMKKDDHLYPISTFGKLGVINRGWDYDEWHLANNYYTSKIYYLDDVNFPLIPIYDVYRQYGEFRDLRMSRLGVLVLSDDIKQNNNISIENNKKEVVSTITFLYKKNNQLFRSENDFRIKFQEYGRLLLLLKNEIRNYVIDYLIEDKILDLWVIKYKSTRTFEKIYANSSHIFNSVYDEMDEFDNINYETLHKLSRTWFFLTNETISYLYSDIARNTTDNGKKHYLNLDPFYIIDKQNTIGDTFSDNFIKLLSELLNTRWKSEGEVNKNVIYINNKKIDKFKMGSWLGRKRILCRKHLIRTFVTQCLHNSLSPLGKGHRRPHEVKRVDIIISDTSISIIDRRLNTGEHFSENDHKRTEQFEKKKKYIKNMNCDEYSSTTLTSLQGLVQYMSVNGICFSCDYGFNKDNNFKVLINY